MRVIEAAGARGQIQHFRHPCSTSDSPGDPDSRVGRSSKPQPFTHRRESRHSLPVVAAPADPRRRRQRGPGRPRVLRGDTQAGAARTTAYQRHPIPPRATNSSTSSRSSTSPQGRCAPQLTCAKMTRRRGGVCILLTSNYILTCCASEMGGAVRLCLKKAEQAGHPPS